MTWNARDVVLHVPHRKPDEPVMIRLTHKPTGCEGVGEAPTYDGARTAAEGALTRELEVHREAQRLRGVSGTVVPMRPHGQAR
jgi:hypothetical protein